MKKSMRTIFARALAVVLCLAALGSVSAFAADAAPVSAPSPYVVKYTGCADELNSLGLFQGKSAGNYALADVPTRAEAATLLVRLLGKEAEAKEANFEHPFTDVADWAAPYIGYLYENKLANGTSATLFGSDLPCDARMFSTFVARSMGYSDAADGDFTYTDAVNFATTLGVIDANLSGGTFLRDNAVAVMYNALFLKTKGAETTLLEKLVADKAVTADAAKALTDSVALFNELNAALEKAMPADVTAVAMSINMEMAIAVPGSETSLTVPVNATAKAIYAENDVQMEMLMDATMLDEKMSVKMYFKDGYMYIDDGTSKTKMSAGIEDMGIESLVSLAESTEVSGMYQLPMLGKIVKTTESGVVKYTMTVNSDLMGGLVESLVGTDAGMSGMQMTYEFNAAGEFQQMTMSADMAGYSMKATVKYTGFGADVKITFPDFSDYVEAQ